MTITAPRPKQAALQGQNHRLRSQAGHPPGLWAVPALRASIIGGFCQLVIFTCMALISTLDIFRAVFLACLVIPAFLAVCLSTGLLAGIFAGDELKNCRHGGEVGWMAGFGAGIIGGVVAMLLAAGGGLMVNFGQAVADQVTPELSRASGAYLTPAGLALAGRVVGAFVFYGVVGALCSGLLSAVGGMVCFELSRESRTRPIVGGSEHNRLIT